MRAAGKKISDACRALRSEPHSSMYYDLYDGKWHQKFFIGTHTRFADRARDDGIRPFTCKRKASWAAGMSMTPATRAHLSCSRSAWG